MSEDIDLPDETEDGAGADTGAADDIETLDEGVIELAEEPSLWLPGEPKLMIFRGEGFGFVAYGRLAWVQHLRLTEEQVAPTVDRVEGILGLKGLDEASWWVGELSTPPDLADRLVELGLEPDDPRELTTMTIGEQPAGEPTVEVRRVETFEELLQALELDWECFGVPQEERELRRREAEAGWPQLQRNDSHSTFLAYDEGEPVGFGRIVYRPNAGILLGGATLPAARGKGVYTSLVHARWAEAQERQIPRLVVAAGPLSAPVLERLGFEAIGRVRTLRQRL